MGLRFMSPYGIAETSRDLVLPCRSADGPEEIATMVVPVYCGLYAFVVISTSSGLPRSCQKAVEALLAVWLIRLAADPSDSREFARGRGKEAAMMIVDVDSMKLESTKTNPVAKCSSSESHRYEVQAEGDLRVKVVVLLFGI